MGRVTAIIEETEVFTAEAEHRFSKPRSVTVSPSFEEGMQPANGSTLFGWLAMAQALASRAGKRLVLKQEGFIGGMAAH
jgi:hypothetical protein